MSEPSDTPRTDALQQDHGIDFRSYKRLWEHARALERELAAKDARITRLEGALIYIEISTHSDGQCADQAVCEFARAVLKESK